MKPVQPLSELIDALGNLPGIGAKTAEKLAYHLMKSPGATQGLSSALEGVSKSIRPCTQCFNYASGELCTICLGANRDHSLLCVVTTPKDLAAIEATGAYKGLYHVLYNEVMTGVPVKTTNELQKRIEAQNDLTEIILATNPDQDGDALAMEVQALLSTYKLKTSQLARGISIGSNLEFLRAETLAGALVNRQEV